MNKKEIIKIIIKTISDTTLEIGCVVQYCDLKDLNDIETYTYLGEFENIDGKIRHHFLSVDNKKVILDINEIGTYIRVIGKPVLIGDVLDYFKIDSWDKLHTMIEIENYTITKASNNAKIISLWKNKRKPIEEQSKECIEYVYNLIK